MQRKGRSLKLCPFFGAELNGKERGNELLTEMNELKEKGMLEHRRIKVLPSRLHLWLNVGPQEYWRKTVEKDLTIEEEKAMEEGRLRHEEMASMGSKAGLSVETWLEYSVISEDLDVTVSGRADGIYDNEKIDHTIIYEWKSLYEKKPRMGDFIQPCCYAIPFYRRGRHVDVWVADLLNLNNNARFRFDEKTAQGTYYHIREFAHFLDNRGLCF